MSRILAKNLQSVLVTDITTSSSIITPTISTSNLYSGTATIPSLNLTGNISATGNSNTLGNIFTTGGNVGIGTTSPQRQVHMNGVLRIDRNIDTSGFILTRTSSDYSSIWKSFQFGVNSTTSGNGSFVISDQGTTAGNIGNQRLIIDNNGNIGIGAISPTTTLDVSGTGRISTSLTVGSILVITNASLIGNSNTLGSIITTGGNVGIGTTSPTFTLDVSGTGRISTSLTTGALYSINQTTTNIVATNISTSTLVASTVASNIISATTITGSNLSLSGNLNVAGTLTTVNITSTNLVNTNVSAGVVVASTLLSATGNSNTIGSIITTAGNVGINTSSPTQNLDVNGNIALRNLNTSKLFVGNATTGSARLNIRDLSGQLAEFQYQYTTVGNINCFTTGAAGLLLNGGGGSNQLVLASTGNIGINTSSPTTKLHVVGNGGANNIFEGTDHVYFQLYPYGFSGGRKAYFGFPDANTKNFWVYNEATSGNIVLSTAVGGSIQFVNASTTAMTITGGNVGIGMTNPAFLLDVNGTIDAITYTGGSTQMSGNIAARGTITNGGFDFYLGNTDQSSRGNSGTSRALVKNTGNVLNINHSGDFTGGTEVQGNFFRTLGNSNTIGSIITTGGNVGIGTATPGLRLDVSGDCRVSGYIRPSFGSGNNGIIFPDNPGGGSGDLAWIKYYARSGEACNLEIGMANDGDDDIYLNPGTGNVGIGLNSPDYKLHVSGDIYATGNIIGFSDSRLKTNIKPITNALNTVNRLKGVRYTHIETNEDSIGLIAQDTMEVLPEVVATKGEYLGINYGNMVGLLVEAIKELKSENEKLKQHLGLI